MIYLSAYFNTNFGDDLFIKVLVQRYPNEKFYICANPEHTRQFNQYKNIKCISKIEYLVLMIYRRILRTKEPIMNLHMLKKSSAVVKIGGSIFMERGDWKNRIKGFDNDNIYYIGANFGPFQSDEFKTHISKIITSCTDCCFRDTYSFEQFKSLKNVRVAPDVIFGFKGLPVRTKGSGVAFSVIDVTKNGGVKIAQDEYNRIIAECCELLIKDGLQVALLSFCESEKDLFVAEQIKKLIPTNERAKIIKYTGNLEGFLESINSYEYVVATRFHAMITGFVLSKKVFPVIYSNKQTNVLTDICFKGNMWNLMEQSEINGVQLKNMILDCEPYPVNDEILDSEKQFEKLDAFFKVNNIK